MAPTKKIGAPDVQVVCVAWGERYSAGEINHLFRSAAENASASIACICISDREREGLDADIQVKPFPAFALPFEDMKDGCRAKLAMFAPGMLLPDVPAIFFDLDTMIAGDISRLAKEIVASRSLCLLANHALPFWRVQKYLRPLLGRRYYFGNSSVVGFIPRDFEFIYHQFNDDMTALVAAGAEIPKRLVSDERHISYAARDRLRVWNAGHVTAFHREFMSPLIWLAELRKRLPWRAGRRRDLIALTFIGSSIKPQEIAAFRQGQVVRVKRHKVRWTFDAYQRYWRAALSGAGAASE